MATLETQAPPRPCRPSGAALPAAALAPVLVLVVSLLAAGQQYRLFLAEHRSLWDNSTHDRNAHYLFALRLAAAARQGRVLDVLDEVHKARVWPPLHGVLAAGVLAVGGLDYRLAVLPSLAGYVGTALLAFLIARRAVPRGGNLAGWTAALFVLASPSHRAYGTDVMLESLGACLSLLVLYAYLRAAQAPRGAAWPARFLGLALTALFLEKYNYWALLVFALLAAELLAHPHACLQLARALSADCGGLRWLRAQLRRPTSWLFVGLLLLIAGVYAWGDRPVVLAGREVSLYPPYNIIHAAYAVLFLRVLAWWRSSLAAPTTDNPARSASEGGSVPRWRFGLGCPLPADAGSGWAVADGRLRQVLLWHAWPAAAWLLLPKHTGPFLWYLSLGNAAPQQKFDLSAGLTDYGRWVAADYHFGLAAALLVGGLALVGLLRWRRLRPGGQAVLLLVLIAGALTVLHPNRKGRCVHSWLAAGWVTAGIGLAGLVHGRLTARRPGVRPWLAGAAALGLGGLCLPALATAGHAPEGGPHPERACLLDLTDCYLPALDHSHRTALLATVPIRPLAQWALLQRYGRLDRLEECWDGFGNGAAANRAGFARWLDTTDCDTLVFLDRLGEAGGWEEVAECDRHAQLRDLVLGQQVFRLVKRQDFPRQGCRVFVWRRDG